MKNLEICMWAINVPDQLEIGCKTFNEKCIDVKTTDCILYMNVDPYPNSENIEQMEELAKKYFKEVHVNVSDECFITKAALWVFSQVKNDVFFSWVGGRSWHDEKFSINKMYNDLINDKEAVQVCLFCNKDETYAKYLMDPCTLCKTDFYKNKYLKNYSIWLCNEYQLREIGLLENKKCRYYENNSNTFKYYGKKWYSDDYKKNTRVFLGNKSSDDEIKRIIDENGEWHQTIYDEYKNKNIDKHVLQNLYLKTKNKKWIYRWTGYRAYVPLDKENYYKRNY